MSQTLALSIDEFFAVQATFLSNLAYLLNIDLSRLHIVSVVPGSVQIS